MSVCVEQPSSQDLYPVARLRVSPLCVLNDLVARLEIPYLWETLSVI